MKILRKLYNWVKKKMAFQINQKAITNFQNWLNQNHGTGWIPCDGFFTATGLSFKQDGNAIFNSNGGYPLKLFVNVNSGEVKIFDARRFYSI